MSIEVMRQALEALDDAANVLSSRMFPDAAAALRAAIEQAEKPVAWMYDFLSDDRDEVIRDWVTQSQEDIKRENGFNVRPLYAAPRQWVGLTDQQVFDLADKHLYGGENYGILSFYKAIEAKLKEKNQ
jgi:hypothetical protein